MVKSDVRRDYYGDLGLAPSAESEDIKRQFRKLALKYHPDRNPGKELEFNAKFQAIQAAHEILSDPQQRLKYDTDRLRAGYGKFYGPPKANTGRKAPANPYTSTPTAKQQSQKTPFPGRPSSFQHGASTGAHRYASYAKAAPQDSWQKKQDSGQTRADAFRGFQDMKGNANMPGWSNFDPRTGRSGFPGAVPRSTPTGQSTRPQSAYEYFRTSPKTAAPDPSRSQSTKKKSGFAPRDAGGDEPMAKNTSAYTSTHRSERFHTSDPFYESVPSPTARKTAAAFGTRRAPDLERSGSKYATSGGEKTFFSSAGLGRSSSTRESPTSSKGRSRTNPSSPTSPRASRHRSASPHTKANRNRAFSSSTSSSDSDEDVHPSRKPKAVPKSRLRPNQKFSDFRAQDGTPGTGEHSSSSTRSKSKRHSSRTSFWARSRMDNWRPRSVQDYFYPVTDRDYVKGHDSDSAASPRNIFVGKHSSGAKDPFNSTSNTADSPQNGAFKSSSHGNLRTQFSAQDWQGTFQQQGFGFFAPTPSDKETTKPTPTRGRTSAKNSAWAGPDSSSQDSPRSASTSQQPTPFSDAKFSAEDWVEQFKNLSWAQPNGDGAKQKANAQVPRSPKKQTKPATKTRSTPQSASVSTEAEEVKATVNGNSRRGSAKGSDGDVEAMDVDDELPSKKAPGPEKTPKTPSKRRQSKSRPSSSESEKDKSAKSKNHLFNMKNLGNTAPFTSTNSGGINDLQDIQATLPFESRPKNPNTSIRDVRPRELNCPNPPRRPRRPTLIPISVGSQQLALQKNSWDRYVAEMNTYMREWNDFNKKFLRHFAARQEAIETGLAPGWISSVGDSARIRINGQDGPDDEDTKGNGDESDDDLVSGSAKGGYSAYLRGLEEDVKVRKHWEVACELHQECILELGQLREWILNGGKVV